MWNCLCKYGHIYTYGTYIVIQVLFFFSIFFGRNSALGSKYVESSEMFASKDMKNISPRKVRCPCHSKRVSMQKILSYFLVGLYPFKISKSTCTRTSCCPTEFITIEKSDRWTLGSRVASAKRMAADMQPSIIAKSFSSCFLTMHSQINSARNQHLF